MTIDVIVTGIAMIFAALVGSAATYLFTENRRNNSKFVEVSLTSTSLVDPEKIGPLSISVNKEFVTNESTDIGNIVEVKSAYSFFIEITNIGNDDLESPEISITLDSSAAILPPEYKADSIPQDKIDVLKEPSLPNYIRVIPKYLNKQKSLSISILSVNNKTEKCEVAVSGLGIKQQMKEMRKNNPDVQKPGFYFMFGISVMLATFIFTIMLMLWAESTISPLIETNPTEKPTVLIDIAPETTPIMLLPQNIDSTPSGSHLLPIDSPTPTE